ncbi:mechanosensitive ion channel domain-containing protein [Nitrosophilus kaiyonis]|uniref:mechanosensitive ion channel domain-containing protein n=1 Tax=Nitrosophilus kaiyonis TaxID=2930200 RepID=UPI002491E409|nr:mechanosensitive ion channel domain-containing protein [Nitrosophilus kaiyonis]
MKKILSILLYLTCIIFASDINTTLIKPNNVKVYESLLKELKSKESNNSEIKLQESLLYKLINISKYQKESKKFTLNQAKNSEELIENFLNIVNVYRDYLQKLDDAKEKEKKLEIIKHTIENLKKEDKKYLTLQLQYAFYYRSYQKLKKQISYVENNFDNWIKTISANIDKITFDKKNIEKIIEKKSKEYDELKNKIAQFKLEYERLKLLERKDKIIKIEKSLKILNQKRVQIIKNIIKNYLYFFFKEVKYKNKKAFYYKNKIEKYIADIADIDNYYTNAFLFVLDKFTTYKMGKTKVFVAETKESIIDFAKYIWSLFKKPIFTLNEKNIDTLDILRALLILIFGIYLGKIYKRYIKSLSQRVVNLTQSSRTLLSNLGYYFIIILSFFISLKAIGIDFTSLTLIAGALSVGIGFGLQNIVSNFISGIILMFEKSIKIGDFIELSEDLRGIVTDISMRSTTITTNDNIDIIIPNQTFIQNNVINWTLTSDVRRLRIPFGVAYGTDIEKVKKCIINALNESDIDFIRKDPFKRPLVVMTQMNNSSVDFELFVWVKGEKTLLPRRTKAEFLELIYKSLYKCGIEIPFPQRDIHIKEPISVNLKR